MSTIERRENPHLLGVVSPDPFNIDYKVARALQPRDGPLWTDVSSFNDVRIQTTPDSSDVEVLATLRGKGLIERTLNTPEVRLLAAFLNPASDPENVLGQMVALMQDPDSLISPERIKKGLALYLELVRKSKPLEGEKLRERYVDQLVITEEDDTRTLALPLNEKEFDLTIGLAAAVTRFARP